MLLLFIFIIVLLFPISIYCWVLSALNRRFLPTLVRGTWDFFGVLLAASGFLLVVAPAILDDLYYKSLLALSPEEDPAMAFPLLHRRWLVLWATYYTLLLAGAFLLIWLRRDKTVLYNVDTDVFPQVFQETLEKMGFEVVRHDRVWRLAPARIFVSQAEHAEAIMPGAPLGGQLAAQQDTPAPAVAEVELVPFAAMCNLTLIWRYAKGALRDEVEGELRRRLDEARALDNPAAGWLLGLCGLLFGLLFLAAVVLVLTLYFPPRHW